MRAVIIYESMFGNTHAVARAIAEGLEPGNAVTLISVTEARSDLLADADLVVIGGPTHAHGMSRVSTRKSAVEQAGKSAGALTLDRDANADGPGLRDWFASLGAVSASGAAFDTRLDAPVMFTGRASKGIARQLQRHGVTLLAPAESFLVTKDNQLRPGETERARQWGKELAAQFGVKQAG